MSLGDKNQLDSVVAVSSSWPRPPFPLFLESRWLCTSATLLALGVNAATMLPSLAFVLFWVCLLERSCPEL